MKLTLTETSNYTPSLASSNGILFLSWTGRDNKLNFLSSSDNGTAFGNKFTSSETSSQGPALCALGGTGIGIAWKGDGNQNLNFALAAGTETAITGLSAKTKLSETSNFAPALAYQNGVLYLAWTGLDGRLNLMSAVNGDAPFGNKYTSSETSAQAPALCALSNSTLGISWKGDGNDDLNVAFVPISGASISAFTNKVTLSETSKFSPALAVTEGGLFLAWSGENGQLNLSYSRNDLVSPNVGNQYTSHETSSQGPSLCALNNTLYTSWSGVGNLKLNIATLPSIISVESDWGSSPVGFAINGTGWSSGAHVSVKFVYQDTNGNLSSNDQAPALFSVNQNGAFQGNVGVDVFTPNNAASYNGTLQLQVTDTSNNASVSATYNWDVGAQQFF